MKRPLLKKFNLKTLVLLTCVFFLSASYAQDIENLINSPEFNRTMSIAYPNIDFTSYTIKKDITQEYQAKTLRGMSWTPSISIQNMISHNYFTKNSISSLLEIVFDLKDDKDMQMTFFIFEQKSNHTRVSSKFFLSIGDSKEIFLGNQTLFNYCLGFSSDYILEKITTDTHNNLSKSSTSESSDFNNLLRRFATHKVYFNN